MATHEVYDAIVVGSGAAGGWAAKELTERGLNTMLLEAGPLLDPVKDFPPPPDSNASKVRILQRARAVLTGQHIQARCMSFSPLTRKLFVSDRENPYVAARGKPFNWYRARQVGGRLHLWGRNALRIADEDLHAASRDGYGQNWPVSYADLAPWYERVERFLGVSGTAAGIANIPDGVYDKPLALTGAEQRALATMAREWPGHPATTCRVIKHNPARTPLPVTAALKTGRLTLRANAVASHLTLDANTGKATGVVFVDRESKAVHEVRGRVVVMCASTIETVRILLNTKSPQHAAGLGNSSGVLGQGITDHLMVFQAGPLEPLEPGVVTDPYDFGAGSGIYIPSFRNRGAKRDADFIRGYSLLGSLARIEPGWFFMAIGEMLPRAENRITLHPTKRDAWGVPAPIISVDHCDNDKAMVRDMHRTLSELASVCGLKMAHLEREGMLNKLVYALARPLVYTREGALVPGSAVHECGGAPMGDDARTSVIDKNNRLWDAPNVFVTDSAAFTTAPFQNPGLTIMALSARAAHYIADEMGRRNL